MSFVGKSSRVGDQLYFEGFEGPEDLRAPWANRSPRELTASYKMFILKAQAGKSASGCVDPEQCDLWLPRKKRPFVYDGAPLLVEF